MTDMSAKLSLACEFASRAVNLDKEENTDGAVYYYKESASLLLELLKSGYVDPSIKGKIDNYITRTEQLLSKSHKANISEKSVKSKMLDQAYFLLNQGLDEDEQGNHEEAIELYSDAVEMCINAVGEIEDREFQEKLRQIAREALSRAEDLKKKYAINSFQSMTLNEEQSSEPMKSSAANLKTVPKKLHRGFSKDLQVSGSCNYTKEELEVLRKSSLINGVEYVPFMFVDLKERFAYPIPFTDRHGRLALSSKQKFHLKRWCRLCEISSEPNLITRIDPFSIKQTCISDCSFVASLAVSALYEKRYNKQLITSIIYPQKRNGEPVYNPCGKYMVKFHLNGVSRKVIIDDYLPLGSSNELLCSFSKNKNEFWVSLLEKAYMKVMGGYDFPGSNSCIDLHALTGWIPERVAIKSETFEKEKFFSKLLDRFHRGDVLITLATGEMSDAAAERAGLVPTHAYAVLDIKEINNVRLLLVKNPWAHLRWKGNYSELDVEHWTENLKKALNYDPKSAQSFDNGVFWIDYSSVCHFFDVFYLSWNPTLFSHTYVTHGTWKAGIGPAKDIYSMSENPQFRLEMKTTTSAAVWVLLTRHITEIDDFRDNKEFIALLVYKNQGKKVYYPDDPPPFVDGTRINSPHYLCKVIKKTGEESLYTLVLSQFEKTTTIDYTLRAYATCPISLSKISDPFKFKIEITNGKWDHSNAGGCANNVTSYKINPRYQLKFEPSSANATLLIELKGPKDYSVGFDVVTVILDNPASPHAFSNKSSGAFRSGFSIAEFSQVPTGSYDIIPATFNPGQKGPFFLTIQSSLPFKCSKLQ